MVSNKRSEEKFTDKVFCFEGTIPLIIKLEY